MEQPIILWSVHQIWHSGIGKSFHKPWHGLRHDYMCSPNLEVGKIKCKIYAYIICPVILITKYFENILLINERKRVTLVLGIKRLWLLKIPGLPVSLYISTLTNWLRSWLCVTQRGKKEKTISPNDLFPSEDGCLCF